MTEAHGYRLTTVEFDFEGRAEREIPFEHARAAMKAGKFAWIDLDFADPERTSGASVRPQAVGSIASAAPHDHHSRPFPARDFLRGESLVSEEVIEDALFNEPSTQHARYPEYIHLVLSGCRQRGQHFDLERLDAIIAERFLLTIHRGPVVFLDAVKRDFREDFKRFAKSPSFLVYELWDHLLENYLAVQKQMEARVEGIQSQLIGEVDDRVFSAVSELGADLLHLRKVLLPARAVLTDLSTRKTIFISEATQPFLANMVGTLEHVLQDLLVDRDILSESLNLYMSVVGHRTNMVMKRLTVVSVIFLPLTFLCGVYGMNFEVLPELRWGFGYLYFWTMVVAVVVGLVVLMRRTKML